MRKLIPVLLPMLLLALPVTAQIKVIPEEKLQEYSSPSLSQDSSSLEFDRRKVLLDTLTEDSSPVEIVFRMRNRSSRRIAITKIASTCSCLKVSADRNVLSPGGTAVLTAVYDPAGHPGRFRRKVSIFTDASSKAPAAVLEIDAVVGWNRDGEYPCALGALRLRRDSLTVSPGETVSVRCINAGDRTLKINPVVSFIPFPVSASLTPSVLQPGQEGKLQITCPSVGKPGTYPLILEGSGARPSDSTIK
ncbi:MAG: DUF1573 domain-containing protein, partial [Candidatus Cryptobacteroides sp.]